MNGKMTKAQRILNPAAAAARDSRIRKENAERTHKLKQIAEELLSNRAFRTWMQIQLESVHFMRPPYKEETDFTRGHRHCVEEQLFKIVGAGGKAGEDFILEVARNYASLAQSYIDPIIKDKE